MPHKNPEFEWTFPAHNDDPAQLPPADSYPSRARQRKTRDWFVWRFSLAVLALVLGIAIYLWHEANLGLAAIERDVQSALTTEQWLAQNAAQHVEQPVSIAGSQSAATAMISDVQYAIESNVTLSEGVLEELAFHHNLAVARVLLTQASVEGDTAVYRQLRFYQQVDGVWVRTTHDSSYWGNYQSLETAYFHFQFRSRDATVVTAVAARLDARYAQLRHELALPPPAQTIMIVIDVDAPSQNVSFARVKDDQLHMPSPGLFVIPAHLTEEQVLYLWLFDPLVRYVLDEAGSKTAAGLGFGPTKMALHQWYLLEQNPLAQEWHSDLLRWMLETAMAHHRQSPETLNAQLRHLCAKHRVRDRILLMKGSAASIHLCITQSPLDSIHFTGNSLPLRWSEQHGRPLTLVRQSETYSAGGEPTTWAWLDTEALLSLMGYVAYRNGRDVPPVLMLTSDSAMALHKEILDLFGGSLEEFEMGWYRHIAAKPDND